MNISIISFTGQGAALAKRLEKTLANDRVEVCQKPKEGVSAWTGERFARKDAILFIGACGIAVRMIAPYVRDKLADSPVLVLDEGGRFVIPVLSGHVGGANELAVRVAQALEATPVITTATDIHHKFAVDVFAKRNFLDIVNREGIAAVSAKILRGETVTVSVPEYDAHCSSEGGTIPQELRLLPYPADNQTPDVLISTEILLSERKKTSGVPLLFLKPKEYVIGIGCRRGKSEEEISQFIDQTFKRLELSFSDVACIASIDRKKEEEGICRWAATHRISFLTFSERELNDVQGVFHGSEFVRGVVGVDNVCERAALAACKDGGRLLLEKQAQNGITLAIAKRNWTIRWEDE